MDAGIGIGVLRVRIILFVYHIYLLNNSELAS